MTKVFVEQPLTSPGSANNAQKMALPKELCIFAVHSVELATSSELSKTSFLSGGPLDFGAQEKLTREEKQ